MELTRNSLFCNRCLESFWPFFPLPFRVRSTLVTLITVFIFIDYYNSNIERWIPSSINDTLISNYCLGSVSFTFILCAISLKIMPSTVVSWRRANFLLYTVRGVRILSFKFGIICIVPLQYTTKKEWTKAINILEIWREIIILFWIMQIILFLRSDKFFIYTNNWFICNN